MEDVPNNLSKGIRGKLFEMNSCRQGFESMKQLWKSTKVKPPKRLVTLISGFKLLHFGGNLKKL